jgi:2-keto-3-deoxy-L-rhamnonate aldolase RhmA
MQIRGRAGGCCVKNDGVTLLRLADGPVFCQYFAFERRPRNRVRRRGLARPGKIRRSFRNLRVAHSTVNGTASMASLIKDRLSSGQLVRAMHVIGYSTPKVVELAATLGNMHGVWIDQEHAAIPHAQLELMAMACRAAGKDVFARVPPTDYATIMRPYEAGCSGVMVAQVRTMAEVEQAVQWAKYPPTGIRGFFGANYEGQFGDATMAKHVVDANRNRWLAIQIETPEAVEIADKIAATPGVDWLFVGPADLSVTLGVPGEFLHSKCVDALTTVSKATKKAGKAWGTLCRDVEHARKCRELGCQFFSIYGDVDFLRIGIRSIEQKFSEFMD